MPTGISDPGPDLPAGYEKSSIWGVKIGSNAKYIASLSNSSQAAQFGQAAPEYRGYSGGN